MIMEKGLDDKSAMRQGARPERMGAGIVKLPRRPLHTDLTEELLQRLEENDINLDTFKSREEFYMRYVKPLLAPTPKAKLHPRQGNILHHIAQLEYLDLPTLVPLVRLLLLEAPDLAKGRDRRGLTALHVALDRHNTHFVEAVTDVLKATDEILGIQDRGGMNCIHYAIEAGLANTLILDLVRKAPEAAFTAKERGLGLTPLHLSVEYDRCDSKQLEVVEGLLRKDHGALGVLSDKGLSPYQYHVATAGENYAESRALKANHKIKEGAARIRDTLKYWILRTRAEDDARRLLYGDVPEDIQLSFALDREPQDNPIPISSLDKSFGGLTFDSTLSLISLGHFRIQEAQRGEKPVGRSDALFIFDWLKRKDIRRVIEVMVKDLTPPSHGDDIIEKALSGLQVERLDWQVADICPAVIRSVGDAVEDLHLYWSGSNAVLRGWSEPEGLPRLPNLARIQVTVLESLQDDGRLHRNLATFRARMLALKPDIQIEAKTTATQQLEALGHTAQTEKWLRCIKDFGIFLDDVERRITHRPSSRDMATVKVALLDNGIDHLAPSIQRRIHSRMQYFRGDTKRGTHIAALIQNVCPQAELHFFKVDLRRGSGEATQDAPQSIVRAFEDAARVHLGIDVMCIPWTIRIAGRNDAATNKRAILARAIQESHEAGIALLCPSPPNLQSEEIWPAHDPEVIKISAAAEQDVAMDKLFHLPGDAKITNQGDSAGSISTDAVATAMAAGLAATILRCCYLVEAAEEIRKSVKEVRESAEEDEENGEAGSDEKSDGEGEQIQPKQGVSFRSRYGPDFIERAFSAIARHAPESGHLMPIWDFFKLPGSLASTTDQLDLDATMAFLSDLVQRLKG